MQNEPIVSVKNEPIVSVQRTRKSIKVQALICKTFLFFAMLYFMFGFIGEVDGNPFRGGLFLVILLCLCWWMVIKMMIWWHHD